MPQKYRLALHVLNSYQAAYQELKQINRLDVWIDHFGNIDTGY